MPDSPVGVDISKTHLDVYVVPAGKAARSSNDAAGFKALIAWVEWPVRSVTYEPTGRWHRAFEEALLKAGLPLVRVNPLHARRFAQSIGQRAKTDAVDARVLAQMGAIDTEIGKRLAEDEGLARRTAILTSIPGVSRITAAGLLTQIPELGRLDAKAIASLAGLAPVTRQSGAWQGRSFIQGGRARARRLLYMPALAAIGYNQDLRAKYRQLVAEGKPRKVAVIAVMRKLLLLANALLEQDRCWLPERPGRGYARGRETVNLTHGYFAPALRARRSKHSATGGPGEAISPITSGRSTLLTIAAIWCSAC